MVTILIGILVCVMIVICTALVVCQESINNYLRTRNIERETREVEKARRIEITSEWDIINFLCKRDIAFYNPNKIGRWIIKPDSVKVGTDWVADSKNENCVWQIAFEVERRK